jgi:hypothetical protein
MLKSSPWMVLLDDRILEHLADGRELSAFAIAVDLEASASLVRSRCRTLTHAGFLSRRDRGGFDAEYSVTSCGRLYLDGGVDADLRRPVPRPRPPHAVRPRAFAGI